MHSLKALFSCGRIPAKGVNMPISSNTPARFMSPVQKNNHVKAFKFLHREKAYIPVPREQEQVANTTMKENTLKKGSDNHVG